MALSDLSHGGLICSKPLSELLESVERRNQAAIMDMCTECTRTCYLWLF